eukprot:11113-Heterococcus_DN1.PRE.4
MPAACPLCAPLPTSRRLLYIPVTAVGDECSEAAADSSKPETSSDSCSTVQEAGQCTHASERSHTGGSVRAEKFDPDRGFRFSTYAVNGIQLALRRAEASQARVVKLPVHIQDTLAQLRHRSRELQVSAMLYYSLQQSQSYSGACRAHTSGSVLMSCTPLRSDG